MWDLVQQKLYVNCRFRAELEVLARNNSGTARQGSTSQSATAYSFIR